MQVIILAAGLGNRLGALTSDRPKALVPVAGRELILRALDFTDDPIVTERIVVTGYRGERLRDFLAQRAPAVRTVHNPRYEEGSVLTLLAALEAIDDEELLLMNVDHIYPRRLFPIVAAPVEGLAAVCDFDRALGADDMKIRRDETGRLAAIDKQLDAYDGGYIGMTRCAAAALPRYRAAAARALETAGPGANVERILAELANDAEPIAIRDASGVRWLEVDTAEERSAAEHTLSEQTDFLA